MDPLSFGPTSICVMLFCSQEARRAKCIFFEGWSCCLVGDFLFLGFMLLCVNSALDCESMTKDPCSQAVFCFG